MLISFKRFQYYRGVKFFDTMVLHMLLPIACCGFQIEYFREKSCLVFKKIRFSHKKKAAGHKIYFERDLYSRVIA